jgi:hypothetical protein
VPVGGLSAKLARQQGPACSRPAKLADQRGARDQGGRGPLVACQPGWPASKEPRPRGVGAYWWSVSKIGLSARKPGPTGGRCPFVVGQQGSLEVSRSSGAKLLYQNVYKCM